jgi:AraC-like DNA-binding protein
LETKFRQELRCSVLDEIRRLQTDKMARLLVETHLSIREIGERLGFDDAQHFARYFQAVKKVTPLAFRKTFARHPGQ